MGKRDEGYNISDTGNWNVASDYSRLKIMKPLYLSDEYSNIAIFGTSSLLEELEVDVPLDYLRFSGFKRLVNCLILLIDNTLFAVNDKDKKVLKKFKVELVKITKFRNVLSKIKVSQIKKTKTFSLIEEK